MLQFRLSKESKKCKDRICNFSNNFTNKNINASLMHPTNIITTQVQEETEILSLSENIPQTELLSTTLSNLSQ